MSAESDRQHYDTTLNWLQGAVHEIPAGVLWGANGAPPEECVEMMTGLREFEEVCDGLNSMITPTSSKAATGTLRTTLTTWNGGATSSTTRPTPVSDGVR